MALSTSPPGPPIEIIGGFESTFLPAHDRDIFETTEHDVRWREDLDLLRRSGITRLRYPVRWHRVEAVQGVFDWSATDEVLNHLRDHGFRPIVDLVHHTSYPAWLEGGFADSGFGPAYLRYAEAFARRYPWVEEYTLFNEPFSTLFLSGHEAIWPPYHSGLQGFIDLLANVLPAVAEASRLYRELLPEARHVWVDTCEFHTGSDAPGQAYADMANERRFLVIDSFLGRGYDAESQLGRDLAPVGGERLQGLEPGFVDVLGLDYYAHCQWNFSVDGGTAPTPTPLPLADQIGQYWDRYGLPCILTETNVRGHTGDRASWLKYVLEQCEHAQARGVPVEGLCWFPVIDSTDWDSLLFRCDGHIDPVGVYWLDEQLDRRESVMSTAYARAATGVRAVDLPAYRFAEPVNTWLRGYFPQMSHWNFSMPPSTDIGSSLPRTTTRMELRIVDAK
ncbi:glycosyl hydrolase family protein [Arthrobacter crusticola]|uniref:Glycosyl hydrolase family protein n=1 Tax=Arthrobacter crusticola TaxID=2547960 RepID=A0A4R5TUW4_9MICC|nr:family 1 glycosylhydrolase [Arthrobacter crusticola]TDK24829.1 glycosyl hydrolase family protein [Arthrobacter crusticola]